MAYHILRLLGTSLLIVLVLFTPIDDPDADEEAFKP
jgi:hypothetical protein